MKADRSDNAAVLAGHQAAQRFFAPCFEGGDSKEHLWVAHVDDAARCLYLGRYAGGESAITLPVRSILEDAIRLGSSGVVLAHNHPSGDPMPSDEDCQATRKLAQAGEAFDLSIVDHLIFAGGECRSLRRMGLL